MNLVMMLAYNSLEESPLLHKVMVTTYRTGHISECRPSALVLQFTANADPHSLGEVFSVFIRKHYHIEKLLP